MSALSTPAVSGRETAISIPGIQIDAAKSELLSEVWAGELFSTYFGPTWGHDKSSLSGLGLPVMESVHEETPVLSTKERPRFGRWKPMPLEAALDSASVTANTDRITLLARKYVAKEQFSDEEAARLAIVTERVQRLLPAVTAREFESLEGILNAVKAIGELDKDIRLSLGVQRAQQ